MCSVNNYFRGQKPHPRHKRCMDWSWTTHIVVFCQLNAHNALRAGGPFGIVPLQPVSQSNYSWCLWTCPVTDAGAVSYWCCGRPVRFHWNHPSPLSASVRIRLDPLLCSVRTSFMDDPLSSLTAAPCCCFCSFASCAMRHFHPQTLAIHTASQMLP